jgi:DNA polymerase-1
LALNERITHLTEKDEILSFLKWIQEKEEITIDLETTGLKPHNTKLHKIAIVGISVDNWGYVFCPPKRGVIIEALKQLLENPDVAKIAQNMKYEYTWLHTIYGIDVKNWSFDTMQAQHILDNRVGTTGLKFQTYVRQGIPDYSSHIEKYLKAPTANSINTIFEGMKIPSVKHDLMKYCALDCIRTEINANMQRGELSEGQKKAYNLVHKGILAFAHAEWQGMRVDIDYINKTNEYLTSKIERLERKVNKSDFIKQWRQRFGTKMNTGSGNQMGTMLYEVLGFTPLKTTASGKGSTDEESLLGFDIPELKMLLEIKKLKKLQTTYLGNFLQEQVDGYMHPFFNLHTVKTYRSSCNSPNFQNIPKRDEFAKKITRDAVFPRPGHQLMEVDFSKLEVSIAACYHKDPTMLNYLKSEHNDMHGDLAQQIFCIDDDVWDRDVKEYSLLRKAAKNGFIFPQFYGDYYKNNAENLRAWVKLSQGKWKSGKGVQLPDGTYISDHLRKHKIKSLTDFENHLKEIEDDFWGNRFKVYDQWKKRYIKQYEKTGIIKLKTGFEITGNLNKNDITNYPVQGAAFHCLLWSFIRMDDIIRNEHLDTRIIGQIHDAIVLDVAPDELDYVAKTLVDITTIQLPKAFDWIIVPLQIDAELFPVDGPWTKTIDYKLPS